MLNKPLPGLCTQTPTPIAGQNPGDTNPSRSPTRSSGSGNTRQPGSPSPTIGLAGRVSSSLEVDEPHAKRRRANSPREPSTPTALSTPPSAETLGFENGYSLPELGDLLSPAEMGGLWDPAEKQWDAALESTTLKPPQDGLEGLLHSNMGGTTDRFDDLLRDDPPNWFQAHEPESPLPLHGADFLDPFAVDAAHLESAPASPKPHETSIDDLIQSIPLLPPGFYFESKSESEASKRPKKPDPRFSRDLSFTNLNGEVQFTNNPDPNPDHDNLWCRHYSLAYYFADDKHAFLKNHMQDEESIRRFFTESKDKEIFEALIKIYLGERQGGYSGLLSDTENFSLYLSELGQNLEKSSHQQVSLALANPSHVMSAHIQKEEVNGQTKYRAFILDPYQYHGNHLGDDILLDNPKDIEAYTAEQLFGKYHAEMISENPSALSFKVVCSQPELEPQDAGPINPENCFESIVRFGKEIDFEKNIKKVTAPINTLNKLLINDRGTTSLSLGLQPHMINVLANALESQELNSGLVVETYLGDNINVEGLLASLKNAKEDPALENIIQVLSRLDEKSHQETRALLSNKMAQSPNSDIMTELNLTEKIQLARNEYVSTPQAS